MDLWLPVNCSNLDDDFWLVYSLPVFVLYLGHTMHCIHVKKVKFSHARYRALGPELIPVYRQSAHR